uniref:Putative calcineurin-like phosphoesterase n=1 Tax=viral metagenome TaxID=1070528 RepID=A0A6H2A255_9ZZZZ
MKIVAVSDTHNKYKDLILPEGDMLIHSGDLDVFNFSSEVKDFNKWLKKQSFKYKIIVAGNHDKYAQINNQNTRTMLKDSCIYLENSGTEIEGIKIWGSPYSPRFGSWFFMAERGEDIKRYWDLIPKDTNILITHGPAYGILDIVPFPKPEHVGCSDLLNKVKEIKPRLHIFGHIHDCYGIKQIEETTFINASLLNEDYQLVNKPIIYDYT